MNPRFSILLGGLAATLFALDVAAQPGPGMQGMSGMGGMSGMQATEAMGRAPAAAPCAKARDPQRCEALQKAKEICKDKAAAEKRKCMSDAMPPMDCSKARSPERCEAMQKAKEACKDKAGPEHRQCMRDNLPKRNGKGGGQPAAPKN